MSDSRLTQQELAELLNLVLALRPIVGRLEADLAGDAKSVSRPSLTQIKGGRDA